MTSFKTLLPRLLIVGVLSVLVSGCGLLDYFKSDDAKLEPAELTKFTQEVKLRKAWKVNVGSGQGKKFNRLHPVVEGGVVYAAGNNGRVVAINAESGKTLWKQDLDYSITGGVGASNGMVLLGTENSEVIALDALTGEKRWIAEVSSEVLSAPATNGRVVIVQSVDGSLTGLNVEDGTRRWIYENSVPALSLRGTSSPLIVENFVLAAMANGTVVSLATDNGTLRWEERVAIPTGRSEIDRLVDIDGELLISENGLVLAPSYQGYVAAIDMVTGQTRWRTKESSYVGASSGFGNIYISSDDDVVKAYKVGQDSTVWVNDQLIRRKISAPLSFSNYVAVGDFEGYVHLLSQVDGRFVGRIKVDGDGVRSRMFSQGNTLFVYGNSGDLVAYRVQ